jgi:sporulation protein YlmC with PRC-barrel domain
MPSALEVREWHTRTVVSNASEKVGKLEDVYVAKDTGEPEFLLVESGFLGHTLHLVPAEGADVVVCRNRGRSVDCGPVAPVDV